MLFQPDWNSPGKAAPFKPNDKMIETMPHGLIATPGSGITENIVDKSRILCGQIWCCAVQLLILFTYTYPYRY